jgi:CDP-diacylglycerol--serine O-phosphatidyltransferase
MFVICAGFRLARFNVQASRPRPLAEGTPKVDKKSFVGLPIPMAGGLIAAIVHFTPTPLINHGAKAPVLAIVMMVLVAFLALLMVSTVRFTSLKTMGTGRRDARLMIGLIALVGLIYLSIPNGYSSSSFPPIWFMGRRCAGITSFTRRSGDKQPAEMREV